MTVPHDPYAVTTSVSLYRVLLRTYPRRFQRQYRMEMATLFRDCCRVIQAERGTRGLFNFWSRKRGEYHEVL